MEVRDVANAKIVWRRCAAAGSAARHASAALIVATAATAAEERGDGKIKHAHYFSYGLSAISIRVLVQGQCGS
jgi:hypothetical protein